jgi:hypothetical protein
MLFPWDLYTALLVIDLCVIVLCPGTRVSTALPTQSHVPSTVLTQACDNNVIAMCLSTPSLCEYIDPGHVECNMLCFMEKSGRLLLFSPEKGQMCRLKDSPAGATKPQILPATYRSS